MSARFEPAEKLHITLAFLGWVDAGQLAHIKATMDHVAAQHGVFPVRLDKVGSFPNERRPRVVWAGAYKTGSKFRALSADLRARFGEMGFAFNTDAVAHVTLCRLKHFDAPLPYLSEFSPIDVIVNEIALFESLQAAQTTRYEILRRAALHRRTTLPQSHASTGSA